MTDVTTRSEARTWLGTVDVTRMRRRTIDALPRNKKALALEIVRLVWGHEILSPQARNMALTSVYPAATRRCGCSKCGGSGYIRAYAHIEGGRCFACDG